MKLLPNILLVLQLNRRNDPELKRRNRVVTMPILSEAIKIEQATDE